MVKAAEKTEQTEQPVALDIQEPVTLRLRPVVEITPDDLLELSSLNYHLQLELTAEGELIVMAPAGTESGWMNGRLGVRLGLWAEQDGTGVYGDSSTGYTLKGNAVRAPDASWILRSRLDDVSPEQRRKYAPICPDFVIELRSPSDRLRVVQRKMAEWLDNGIRLGWLIDPDAKRIYIYQPGAAVRQLDNPESVSGDPVLPGFVLKLGEIW
jgi:Uma2 family endonuclease